MRSPKFRFRAGEHSSYSSLDHDDPDSSHDDPDLSDLEQRQLPNTLVGIALPDLVSGFNIFLFRQFMTRSGRGLGSCEA